MSSGVGIVEVRRGGLVESRHRVSAALIDEQGRLLAHVGDPELVSFFRSAAKPFQALPLVADSVTEAFAFSDAELAICCASHSGEPLHVETVLGLLRRVGCSEDDLECGPHPPFHQPSAEALRREGRPPTRVHNNCSGKHTGMLAWSRHMGVETVGYRRADHPVQLRIRRQIAELTGTPSDRLQAAVDGCGVVTYAQPLNGMAAAFARLVGSAERDAASPAGRVVRAMTGQPYYVGGSGRLSTRLMQTTGGRLLAKYGAEAVMCLADRERRWGAAVKIEDGQKRAVGPAVVEFLAQAGLLSEGEQQALGEEHVTPVLNTRGEVVGELRARLRLAGSG